MVGDGQAGGKGWKAPVSFSKQGIHVYEDSDGLRRLKGKGLVGSGSTGHDSLIS